MEIGNFKDNAIKPIIAIDFDGTLNMVNNYPECGEMRPFSNLICKYLHMHNVKIVIWTCRDDDHSLGLMSDFLNENEIHHDSINSSFQYAPFGYESRKIYAHMYVDDRGYGWSDSENVLLSVYREFMTRYTNVDSATVEAEIVEMVNLYQSNNRVDIDNISQIWDIYTDGGCWNDNGYGAWAYTVFKDKFTDEEPLRCVSGQLSESTNNRAEMQAILEGIRSLPPGCIVNVYTDSGYCQYGFTKPNYLSKWMQNNWKTSQNKPVQNVDLWKELVELSTKYQIRMFLVKGHGKDLDSINRKWNDMVDSMCTAEMQKYINDGTVIFSSRRKI